MLSTNYDSNVYGIYVNEKRKIVYYLHKNTTKINLINEMIISLRLTFHRSILYYEKEKKNRNRVSFLPKRNITEFTIFQCIIHTTPWFVYTYRFLASSRAILWNIEFIEKDVCRKVEMSENPAIVTNAQLEAIFIHEPACGSMVKRIRRTRKLCKDCDKILLYVVVVLYVTVCLSSKSLDMRENCVEHSHW